ncbi:MAG: DUF4974 domain-containing protein [Bacteroidetes bacterium]|nr:DUF4974 domain-containing protein [Bacteroidota bacterium]
MSEKTQTYYANLAIRYLSGNASDTDIRELEAWVQADPEHKRIFMTLKKAWMMSGMQQPAKVDVHRNLKVTWQKLDKEAKVVSLKPQKKNRSWIGIAATLLFLIAAATVLWLQPWQAASFTASAEDEIETFELLDGSEVVLNQSSSIEYVFNKKTNTREVQLQGDAFFEVQRDEAHPFVIKAGSLEIEVLGTSFYVDARADQPEIQVIVESGRVAVRSLSAEAILEANEKAVFTTKTGNLQKQENENFNYLAIKTKRLSFESTPLRIVVFDLNRYYKANISLENQALEDCPLTADYTDKALSVVLRVLESSLGVNIEETAGGYQIKGSCE